MAQAYEQFLIGHHLEENDDVNGAVAAYKKAIELDPLAADIPAELAGLYSASRQDRRRGERGGAGAESRRRQSGSAPRARSHRRGEDRQPSAAAAGARPTQTSPTPFEHLEKAIANPIGEADPNARGTLARLYLRIAAYDKAIPLLVDLVRQQPAWLDGPRLLAQAYAGAGRTAEAIDLLDEQASEDPSLLPTLADFYERQERWEDAAGAYARALNVAPRNVELKTRYAQALLNAGGHDSIGKARDALNDIVSTRNDARALYLLSQADRRFGDLPGAEAAARRVIAVQDQSPWGYFALAEALEEDRQYDADRRRVDAGDCEVPRAGRAITRWSCACCCPIWALHSRSLASTTRR